MMIAILIVFFLLTIIIIFPSQLSEKKQQLKDVEVSFDIRQHQLKMDYQFRRKELLRRFKAEDVTEDEYSQLMDELDLETSSSLDTAQESKVSSKVSKSISLATILAVAVTLVGANSYWNYGSPELAHEKIRLIEMIEQNPTALDYLTQQAISQRTKQANLELLHAARLLIELKPLDPKSWYQFSQVLSSYSSRSEIAIKALRRARELDPKNNQIKLALSRLLMGKKDAFATKEAFELDQDVLKEQPNNEEALLGLGFSAFNDENYELAIASWEKVLKNREPNSEGVILLKRSIQTAKIKLAAETTPVPGSDSGLNEGEAGASITLSVEIADEIKRKLKGNETLFVFARAASGPPMPLAAVRFPIGNYPGSIKLSDQDAMRPELKLSSFKQIQLVARISVAGSALAQKGDFEGSSDIINAPFTGKTFTIIVDHQR